jgi:hypothetical protein
MVWRDWFSKRNTSTPPLFLTDSVPEELDVRSSAWAFVRNYLIDELAKAREANDSSNKTDIQTAELRGQIKFIKKMLSLPEKAAKKENKKNSQHDDYDY